MRRIVPGLYSLTGLTVGRVYLITEGDGLTLIDASLPFAAGQILGQIRKLGFAATDVRRILITHAHPDHVGALPALVEATGAEVWASRLERPVIEGAIPIMRSTDQLRGVAQLMAAGEPMRFPRVPVARELRDGEALPEVFDGLQVIATPGHAPGHLSFWHPGRRLVILGDVIMHLPTRLLLPVAAFTYDMAENIRSVGRVARLEPNIVCFGHGAPLTASATKRIGDFAQRVGAI
ncbi:MBL fold metallo-hydrolase [Oscillochloris sp. ZM17-4]|uniref:MBL fold metallo-hydrolase n=1 Tax=Oscillochloris sp. ZM17-4 TaxID=2866714 RepID=UPI001C73ADCD|nr:MBL fold metallo-hydrolase [Oscillochloris sp. ZM17-4]MBX0330291.1 MBL fold metallo-hydrolase [Oscillochloris sp. ZM17-4]